MAMGWSLMHGVQRFFCDPYDGECSSRLILEDAQFHQFCGRFEPFLCMPNTSYVPVPEGGEPHIGAATAQAQGAPFVPYPKYMF